MKNSHKKVDILIATGGTGGHVFPAQALAKQLLDKRYSVIFMGKSLTSNPYFARDQFKGISIDSATPFSRGISRKIFSFFWLGKGICQAFQEMGDYRPSLVVGFGSFHTFPVLAAAFLKKVPIVLFESNSIPGKVNQLFSGCAQFSGLQFSEAKERLKGTCYEVEMPFWKEDKAKEVTKREALDYFSLDPDCFTLLVFGGSQGASFMNPIVAEAITQVHQEIKKVQVIHMTGSESSTKEIQSFYEKHQIKAKIKPFEENMHLAWICCDMVICRAGAATLAEIVEFEVPALLIPFPKAAENHQLKNAIFLQEEVGGAFYLEEKDLDAKNLFLLFKNCNIAQMKESILAFKRNKKKKKMIDLIEEFLHAKE